MIDEKLLEQEAKEAVGWYEADKQFKGFNQGFVKNCSRGYVDGYIDGVKARTSRIQTLEGQAAIDEEKLREATEANQHLLETEAGLVTMVNMREDKIIELEKEIVKLESLLDKWEEFRKSSPFFTAWDDDNQCCDDCMEPGLR